MSNLTILYVERLQSCGVKIIEINLLEPCGHVVIADIVHCSSESGKRWHEEHSVTLRSNRAVLEYLQAIS